MVGWSALAAGLGVVLARYTWEQPLWLIPYALFWVWIIALAIRRVPERFDRACALRAAVAHLRTHGAHEP